ncbi:SDR family oxidoreductase [Micromonospora echinofusca]|uniref:NAD-dependent epimerase/dehydratase family protein n=1 Tax=Micromonospora echinofusca TaxID=47858 RepID=A0ABS3VWS2_MICEH|nr:SDR family oxidoreductase [Micromonospora echinofusca]MBO4208916.1 NAD-dependent epimerase/dehydratase family protein [Micromonospora echinofusca]
MSAGRILVTGLGGALGSELAQRLTTFAGSAELVGIFSSNRSRDRFLERADPVLRVVLRAEVCDLSDAAAVAALATRLGRVEHTLVAHVAANVSWTLPLADAVRANVDVTRHVATLARRTSATTRFVYVSSAFTATENWRYRNTYEESKAAAERMLRADFADLTLSVFSCSLVVGHSRSGSISRFHGIYPLVRLIERYELPFIPAARNHRMDIVPVDWVAEELFQLMAGQFAGRAPRHVVASAGPAAPMMTDLVSQTVAVLNRHRLIEGRPIMGQVAVLGLRQYDFLRRSLDSWQVGNVRMPSPRVLDRVMATYRPYLEDGNVLPPSGTTSPVPAYADYLDPVISFWLDRSRRDERQLSTV